MGTLPKVSHIGCDLHQNFTMATACDAQNRLVWRQRLEHADRPRLRARLETWPQGTPVIFEASFGWGWFADEVQAAQLEPHLARSRQAAPRPSCSSVRVNVGTNTGAIAPSPNSRRNRLGNWNAYEKAS